MVRLADLPADDARHLAEKPCPRLPDDAFVAPRALNSRRFALVTTAGIGRRSDEGFDFQTIDYRVIPDDVDANDLVMTHLSVNFDRTGFAQDLNITFPIDRFHELVDEGVIGGVGRWHYSFMGALTEPLEYEATARQLAAHLKADDVDSVFLTPI